MGLKIRLFDIWNRPTKFNKKAGIILNGIDNLYAEKQERYINNSVTAKTSAVLMASYLAGLGFGDDEDKIVVHKKNKTTLQNFTNKLSRSFTRQRGAFIHVNWDMNFKISSFDLLPYVHCRLGKKDDDKYNGKIAVTDKWSEKRVKVDEINYIDVYNPNEDVIKAQVEAVKAVKGKTVLSDADKWKAYKGQILYVNLDEEYDYALSTIDAVQYDCDAEAQASLFKNKSLRQGFFGKTVVITKPLIGNIDEYDDTVEGRKLYQKADSERTNFKNTMGDFIGAENTGNLIHVEVEHEEDKLEDAILFKNIPTDINDKMFEYTETSVFKNILMAFNNLPSGLVRSDNTLFANSGESLKEMRKVYQINTKAERNEVEQTVQMLMKRFVEPIENLELIPLIDETEDVKTSTEQDISLILKRTTNGVANKQN